MEFEIIEIEELSSDIAHTYSVILDDGEYTLFDKFFEENKEHGEELKDILERLTAMKNKTGFRRDFFTHNEGSPGEGIAVLKSGEMRLYCIYFDRTVIIFGDGGLKQVRAWQDDKALTEKVELLRKISQRITTAIREKDIVIQDDGVIRFNNETTFEI